MSWQPHRCWLDNSGELRRCGGRVETRGARPGGGVHRRVYLLSRRVEGKARGITGVEPSSPAVKIPLTPRRYPSTWARTCTPLTRIAVGDRRRWCTLNPPDSTVPSEIQFMMPDRATSEQFFSNFCITTLSSICTKVVGLSSNYNFATRCSHKKSLNHA
jgi:hypothetical protein